MTADQATPAWASFPQRGAVIHPADSHALPPVEGQICVIAGVDIAEFTRREPVMMTSGVSCMRRCTECWSPP